MRKSITQILSSLMVAIMIIAGIPIQALAEQYNDNGNGGDGGGTGQSSGSYTWNENQSGYRITLVNQKFEQVSSTVDFIFSEPSSGGLGWGNNYYTNSRAKSLSNNKDNYKYYSLKNLRLGTAANGYKGVINAYPPYPIEFQANGSGGYKTVAGGERFKEWFLAGKEGMGNIIEYESRPVTNTGGTTRPNTSNDPKPSNDMGYIAEFTLFADASYREDKHWEAFDIVYAQGYYSHAQTVIRAQVTATKNAATFRVIREDIGYNDLVYDEILGSLNYYQSISKTYAEFVYITTSIIRNTLGIDWEPENGLIIMQRIEQSTGLNTNKETNTGTKLEDIPLAEAFNGYCDELLNYKENGVNAFTFNVSPATMTNGGRSADGTLEANQRVVTEVAVENNYSIIVEPIFFFRPAMGNSQFLPSYPTHPNYVYGTMANFVDFYNNEGFKYGPGGGAYNAIGGNLGWRCMYVGRDWVGTDGGKITALPSYTGTKHLGNLVSPLASPIGYAMHIYNTGATTNNQSTWNPNDPSIQHAAPIMRELATPTGYSKQYKIVKYYQDIYTDGTVENAGPFYADDIIPNIDIVDEGSSVNSYKAKDWFVTKTDITSNVGYTSFTDAENGETATQNGTGIATVHLEFDDANNTKADPSDADYGERTLFLMLQRNVPLAVPGGGPLILSESEISKSVTTMNAAIPNWGPRTFTFSYANMIDSDSHPVGLGSVPCNSVWGDSAYNYIITNSATIDAQLEANAAGGAFASRMLTNTKSGNANMGGGTNTLDTAEYQSVIWRGLDVPTIASYKESASLNLRNLLNRYDKEPAGDRGLNGTYTRPLLIQLSVDASSDITTHTNHSFNSNDWHTSTHTSAVALNHSGDVTVNVYRGTNGKLAGNETNAAVIPTVTPFGAASSINSAGYMVQQITKLYFYPYLRMSYQVTGSVVKTDVNVVSQFFSEILPNDLAEAAWYNPDPESLKLSSTQWSSHARAVNGGQSWNGRNQVLPAGSIFQLGSGAAPTKVALVTWQTIIAEPERSALSVALPANEYTLAKANSEHNQFVSESKTTLESLRVVQWVNKDVNATNGWTPNGQGVKIVNGDQSLTELGLDTKTSTESKYRLGKDNTGDAANEGDIDIIADNPSSDTFYKVFADTSGDVYLAKSVGNLAALTNVNGSNPGSATKILGKTVTWANVQMSLTDSEAREINQRTMLVTNLVKSLERAKGSDNSASWALSDGKWYSEAWDGIYVVRKANIIDIGLNMPGVRSCVLDTAIMPKNSGRADLFSTAYLSQFRLDSKSDSPTAQSKGDGFIGSFQGRDVFMTRMTDMYMSKRFYIPNVSVQDLN